MERHEFDVLSAVFGVLFAVIGGGFLIANVQWASLNGGAVWAFVLIGLGLLLAGSAVHHVLVGQGEED